MIDIFEKERRVDPTVYYRRILKLMINNNYYYETGHQQKNLWNVFDMYIMSWEYKNGACSSNDYLQDLGIDYIDETEDIEKQLQVIQYILNMAYFIDTIIHYSNDKEESYAYDELVDMISFYLEKVNYRFILQGDVIKLTKRDADVDSVIQTSACDDNLANCLLSYYDLRIKKDVKEKQIILNRIANWLEPKREYYDSINKTLTEEVFKILNKAKIRHNNDRQYNLNDSKLIELYDKAFKMILHLIRTEDIIKIQNEIDQLDNK